MYSNSSKSPASYVIASTRTFSCSCTLNCIKFEQW